MLHLEDLDISDNKIKNIDEYIGAFNLDISNNKLRNFTPTTASYLPVIREINLKGNHLGNLETKDIKSLFENTVEIEYKDAKGSQKSIKSNSSTGKRRKKSINLRPDKGYIIHFSNNLSPL